MLYTILFWTAAVAGLPVAGAGLLLSPKLRKTAVKRLGLSRAAGPDSSGPYSSGPYSSRLGFSGKPIWVHALSVGEVRSVVSLAKSLCKNRPSAGMVFSVSTLTGFEMAQKELPELSKNIFFFPYDVPFLIKKVIKKINPRLVVMAETDVWPHFVSEIKRRDIPLILVNARLSDGSFAGYSRFRFFFKRLFSNFSAIAVQSDLDAARFKALGVPPEKISTAGNLKFDPLFDAGEKTPAQTLAKSVGVPVGPTVFLAGSVHKGEEPMILNVFKRLRRMNPNLLMIMATRNPARAKAARRLFEKAGFSSVFLPGAPAIDPKKNDPKKNVAHGKKWDAAFVDRIGWLRCLYGLADVAFVGGSLVEKGGQNPLEPAAFSTPIIFGSDMSDFAEISAMLLENGGAIQVHDAHGLYDAATALLSDPENARSVGKKAHEVFAGRQGALSRTLRLIDRTLDRAKS